MKDNTVFTAMTIRLPVDQHYELKKHCVINKLSMHSFIVNAINLLIERERNETKKNN